MEHHHHFCQSCEAVTDVHHHDLEDVVGRLEAELAERGLFVSKHEFNLLALAIHVIPLAHENVFSPIPCYFLAACQPTSSEETKNSSHDKFYPIEFLPLPLLEIAWM